MPPGFKPHAARRHWQHAASNDARDGTHDNNSGDAATAWCAVITAKRKRLHWRYMRDVLASSDTAAGNAGQSRKTQRRAYAARTTRSVRAYPCKGLALAMSRRWGAHLEKHSADLRHVEPLATLPCNTN